MEELRQMLKDIGDKNGLEISLDENGSCSLELSDGRVLLIQERAGIDELDFVATLGPVPEERRAAVFTDLLAANFYWKETYGATISWNADLEEAVIMYPVGRATATPESVETIFARFLELQSAWADRLAGLVADEQDDDEDGDDGENGGNEAGGKGSDLMIKA